MLKERGLLRPNPITRKPTRRGRPWKNPGPRVRGANRPGRIRSLREEEGRRGQRAGCAVLPQPATCRGRAHPRGRRGAGARGGCHVADLVAGGSAVPAPRTGVSPEAPPAEPCGPYQYPNRRPRAAPGGPRS